ncbi:MAG: hypothetical protein ACR2KT_06055 [Methylocella sp.]|nr:MAG: hypothetical protein DLM68_07425 [Hyphomicrobiales bacterium]
MTLFLNDLRCRSWSREDHPLVHAIRWFSEHQVIAWLVEFQAAVISPDNWHLLSIGRPERILLSKNHIFVGYGDESTIGARPGELEFNVVAVFSRDGEFQFGLRDIFSKDNYKGTIIELNAGYTSGERMIFNAYSANYLWRLDPRSKSYKRFHVPFETALIEVLSGDDKHAVAILKYCAPFEFAVFDLALETSAKQDFAPIETALIDAGFAMSEIKFQPNSTGRIIVSDTKQAALLEFCDLA